MFAVFQCGGKQYNVSEGSIINVEKISNLSEGEIVDLGKVLFFSGEDKKVIIDQKILDKTLVSCKVVKHFKDDKIIVFKKKRRKNYRRKYGHRQLLTQLQVLGCKVI